MKHRQLNEHRLAATPNGDIEWLMQPGDAPVNEHAHIDVVAAAIDNLPDSMRDVLHAVFFEQVPYSELGERLGCSKTQAWRKAQAAISELTAQLSNHPTLTERYT